MRLVALLIVVALISSTTALPMTKKANTGKTVLWYLHSRNNEFFDPTLAAKSMDAFYRSRFPVRTYYYGEPQ